MKISETGSAVYKAPEGIERWIRWTSEARWSRSGWSLNLRSRPSLIALSPEPVSSHTVFNIALGDLSLPLFTP